MAGERVDYSLPFFFFVIGYDDFLRDDAEPAEPLPILLALFRRKVQDNAGIPGELLALVTIGHHNHQLSRLGHIRLVFVPIVQPFERGLTNFVFFGRGSPVLALT